MKQYWWCAKCKQSGSVQYRRGADAWSVVGLVREAHRKARPGIWWDRCKADPQVLADQETVRLTPRPTHR